MLLLLLIMLPRLLLRLLPPPLLLLLLLLPPLLRALTGRRACAGGVAASTRALVVSSNATPALVEMLRSTSELMHEHAAAVVRLLAECGGACAAPRTHAHTHIERTLPALVVTGLDVCLCPQLRTGS